MNSPFIIWFVYEQDILRKRWRRNFETPRASSLLKRFITPEEVANLVAYYVTPLALAMNVAALESKESRRDPMDLYVQLVGSPYWSSRKARLTKKPPMTRPTTPKKCH